MKGWKLKVSVAIVSVGSVFGLLGEVGQTSAIEGESQDLEPEIIINLYNERDPSSQEQLLNSMDPYNSMKKMEDEDEDFVYPGHLTKDEYLALRHKSNQDIIQIQRNQIELIKSEMQKRDEEIKNLEDLIRSATSSAAIHKLAIKLYALKGTQELASKRLQEAINKMNSIK